MTSSRSSDRFTAPWLLASAVLVFALALMEKALNMVGLSLPMLNVFPRQLLDWALVLLVFDIAITLRQVFEQQLRREETQGSAE